MIQVVIEMDPQTNELTIRGAAPPPIIFAIVVNAYHELLAAKIRADLTSERRILRPENGFDR